MGFLLRAIRPASKSISAAQRLWLSLLGRRFVSGTAGLGRGAFPTPERLDEFAERLLIHVGNGDIGEVRVGPAGDVIAIDRFDAAGGANSLGVERQLGHRDKVLVVAVNESRSRDPINDGDAPAFEREALAGEIDDARADRRVGGKPGFHCMPIGRSDVSVDVKCKPSAIRRPRKVRRAMKEEALTDLNAQVGTLGSFT